MRIDAQLRQAWQTQGDHFATSLPAGWGQGRTVYGGMSAAYAVALGQRLVDETWQLRCLQAQFLRPLLAGPVEGRAMNLREGKTTRFSRVELWQEGKLSFAVDLTYALPRPEGIVVAPEPVEDVQPPEKISDLPYLPGVTPEFTQHVQMRWAEGAYPFTTSSDPRLVGYCRFREGAGDIEGVVALLDVWPSPSLSLLSRPSPASSVTWTAHIYQAPASLDEGWYRFGYRTRMGQRGLHTVSGDLRGPNGELLAHSEQLVAIFE